MVAKLYQKYLPIYDQGYIHLTVRSLVARIDRLELQSKVFLRGNHFELAVVIEIVCFLVSFPFRTLENSQNFKKK